MHPNGHTNRYTNIETGILVFSRDADFLTSEQISCDWCGVDARMYECIDDDGCDYIPENVGPLGDDAQLLFYPNGKDYAMSTYCVGCISNYIFQTSGGTYGRYNNKCQKYKTKIDQNTKLSKTCAKCQTERDIYLFDLCLECLNQACDHMFCRIRKIFTINKKPNGNTNCTKRNILVPSKYLTSYQSLFPLNDQKKILYIMVRY